MSKKINFFTMFSLIGVLCSELNEAAEDGVITVTEGIKILESICRVIGIDLDKKGINL